MRLCRSKDDLIIEQTGIELNLKKLNLGSPGWTDLIILMFIRPWIYLKKMPPPDAMISPNQRRVVQNKKINYLKF